MELIEYHGWRDSVRLANDAIELVAITQAGPRILRLAFLDGENLFQEIGGPDCAPSIPGMEWRNFGGHRLWHAPEVLPRSYAPDNDPVKFTMEGRELRLVQNVEPATGIGKEMRVSVAPGRAAAARIDHVATNHNVWPVELALWALSVTAPGGRVILPHAPFRSHGAGNDFLPSGPLALWPFTDMADPRWTWGKNYIQLRSDASLSHPQKLGCTTSHDWAAYTRVSGDLLVIFSVLDAAGPAAYPDFGCHWETYTAGDFQELESLGPLVTLAPGASATHTEYWALVKTQGLPSEDQALHAILPGLVDEARATVRTSLGM